MEQVSQEKGPAGKHGLVVLGKVDAEGDPGEHAEIRRHVLALRDSAEQNTWALSAVLADVYRRGLYVGWGFSTWAEYVEKELGFRIRKAQQLVQVEEWLSKLPPKVAAWFRTLTYTKARMLCGVVTKENAAEWRAKIEGRTVMEIDRMLHQDAQEAMNDPDGKGADAGLGRQPPFRANVTPAQRANIMRALEIAAHIAGCDTTKDRLGYLLDLVSTEYLAGNSGIETVQDYLAQVEAVISLRLIAYNVEKDEIAYGMTTLEELKHGATAEDPDEEAETGIASVH